MRNILLFVAAIFLLFSVAHGQPAPAGGIRINSRPSGCAVYISGEIELATTTPAIIDETLRGTYTVRASRPGYENWLQQVTFTAESPRVLTIVLTPKTRFKAALRSLIVPGWGQYYAGEKSRSALWGVTLAATGVVAGLYEARFHDRESEWQDALEMFDRAETIAEKERLQDEVFRLQGRAYDAESDRRIAWGILAGVWAVNVLDAVIFFPTEKRFSSVPLTVRPTLDGTGSLATFTFKY